MQSKRPSTHLWLFLFFAGLTFQLFSQTTFVEQDGQPSQKILSSLTLDIPIVDISQTDEDEVDAAIAQQRQTLTQRHFDLVTGPLLRACLLRIDGQTTETDDHFSRAGDEISKDISIGGVSLSSLHEGAINCGDR